MSSNVDGSCLWNDHYHYDNYHYDHYHHDNDDSGDFDNGDQDDNDEDDDDDDGGDKYDNGNVKPSNVGGLCLWNDLS